MRDPFARAIAAIAILCLLVGVWARFSGLATKYYYRDEVYTSLHVAGFTVAQLRSFSAPQALTAAQFVERFQAPQKSAGATLAALAVSDAQHPPLYYLIARVWQQMFGSSIVVRRALSAVFGTALIAAVFWLGLTLYGSLAGALFAASLVAVSPYQITYSQEVREWSLFELLAVLSAIAMIRAVQTQDYRRAVRLWMYYGLALTLTLYAALLGVVVFAAFVVFMVWTRQRSSAPAKKGFVIASSVAVLLYVPWIVQLLTHWREANSQNAYAGSAIPLKIYLAKLVFTFATGFFDAEYAHLRLIPFAILALVLALYGAFRLAREGTQLQRAFTFSLIATNVLAFVVSDIAAHASRAAQERYMLPAVLGLQLCAAYIAVDVPRRRRIRAFSGVAAAALLVLGLSSIVVSHRRASWWNNNDAESLAQVARYTDASADSVTVFDDAFVALQFSDLSRPGARIALEVPAARGYRTVYAVNPRPATVALLRSLTGTPGSRIALGNGAGELSAIHAQVAQAHGLARGPVLWKFVERDSARRVLFMGAPRASGGTVDALDLGSSGATHQSSSLCLPKSSHASWFGPLLAAGA